MPEDVRGAGQEISAHGDTLGSNRDTTEKILFPGEVGGGIPSLVDEGDRHAYFLRW